LSVFHNRGPLVCSATRDTLLNIYEEMFFMPLTCSRHAVLCSQGSHALPMRMILFWHFFCSSDPWLGTSCLLSAGLSDTCLLTCQARSHRLVNSLFDFICRCIDYQLSRLSASFYVGLKPASSSRARSESFFSFLFAEAKM
jgi:hypothetical protein